MADIKERIANVGQFFKGMQVTKVDDTDVIYVIVSFPPRWLIDDAVTEKFDVNVMDGNEPGEHLFCAEMSTGFDKVFDAVDHCVRENREAMERAQLFQEKINELKEIFGDEGNSIKRLRTLEFTFPKQRKDVSRKRQAVEEVAEKELENNGNETE